MNQNKYIRDLLEKVQLNDSKLAFTPMQTGQALTKQDREPMINATMYRIVIEALQ